MPIEVVDVELLQKLRNRYAKALHAVQSGVAMTMRIDDGRATSPKSLRVGVNSAMIDNSALADLLMKKGIISETEYLESLAKVAEAEQAMYEAELSRYFCKEIKLE